MSLHEVVVDDPFWRRMQAIWDAQKAAGQTASDSEALAAEARAEWDERQMAIERLQGECRAVKE